MSRGRVSLLLSRSWLLSSQVVWLNGDHIMHGLSLAPHSIELRGYTGMRMSGKQCGAGLMIIRQSVRRKCTEHAHTNTKKKWWMEVGAWLICPGHGCNRLLATKDTQKGYACTVRAVFRFRLCTNAQLNHLSRPTFDDIVSIQETWLFFNNDWLNKWRWDRKWLQRYTETHTRARAHRSQDE